MVDGTTVDVVIVIVSVDHCWLMPVTHMCICILPYTPIHECQVICKCCIYMVFEGIFVAGTYMVVVW